MSALVTGKLTKEAAWHILLLLAQPASQLWSSAASSQVTLGADDDVGDGDGGGKRDGDGERDGDVVGGVHELEPVALVQPDWQGVQKLAPSDE